MPDIIFLRMNELISAIGNNQFAIEPGNDVDLGFPMAGYKKGGVAYKLLAKDKAARISSLQIQSLGLGYLKSSAAGIITSVPLDGSTIEHGTLLLLGIDDHTIYHNNARGDARYLYIGNTVPFTPSADYHPSTKKYSDDNDFFERNVPGTYLHAKTAGDEIWIPDNNKYFKVGDAVKSGVGSDGTNMVLKADITSPSDVKVICGVEKTLKLDAGVWEDINLGGAILPGIPGQEPDIVQFKDDGGTNTGIRTLAVDIGEGVSGSMEVPHSYKEGTDIFFHIHWQGITAPTGIDNVKWQLTFTIARSGLTLASPTVINIETGFDTQYEFIASEFVAITGASIKIEDQFLFSLERVAASTDEYGGDALLATLGLHYEVETMGSRQKFVK